MKTTRLNSLSVYASCGTLAGMAARHGDGARARQFKAALAEAVNEGVADAEVLEVAPQAYSGRLEFKGGSWEYCVGQYFPTEYRKAARVVLEAATALVRRSRPARVAMPRTIAELKALNRKNGGHWFDPNTMRFFGTWIHGGVWRERYFITSEQPPHGPRAFTVREFDAMGNVETVGELGAYKSLGDAAAALRILP